MSNTYKKEDLRIRKTYSSLISAMITLLAKRKFCQITVYDLCEEALVSRATFYMHFEDKYNLLSCWLEDVKLEIVRDISDYEGFEMIVNSYIHKNKKVITNLLKDANDEVFRIVQDFLREIVESVVVTADKRDRNAPNYITFYNFCVGGITNLLMWQVKNGFPSEYKLVTKYMYNMLQSLSLWDAQQKV